jgi:hypothetical protein
MGYSFAESKKAMKHPKVKWKDEIGGCGQKVGLNTLRKEIEDVFRGTISKSPGGL